MFRAQFYYNRPIRSGAIGGPGPEGLLEALRKGPANGVKEAGNWRENVGNV